jgi:hypothetical protein
MIAIKYAPIKPSKMGIILIMPLPHVVHTITIAKVMTARSKLELACSIAHGASIIPIRITVGAVTTTGI